MQRNDGGGWDGDGKGRFYSAISSSNSFQQHSDRDGRDRGSQELRQLTDRFPSMQTSMKVSARFNQCTGSALILTLITIAVLLTIGGGVLASVMRRYHSNSQALS